MNLRSGRKHAFTVSARESHCHALVPSTANLLAMAIVASIVSACSQSVLADARAADAFDVLVDTPSPEDRGPAMDAFGTFIDCGYGLIDPTLRAPDAGVRCLSCRDHCATCEAIADLGGRCEPTVCAADGPFVIYVVTCDGPEDCIPGAVCCERTQIVACAPAGSCTAVVCNSDSQCPASSPHCCESGFAGPRGVCNSTPCTPFVCPDAG